MRHASILIITSIEVSNHESLQLEWQLPLTIIKQRIEFVLFENHHVEKCFASSVCFQ